MAGLLWQVAGRALPRKSTRPPEDDESLIEAILTGDLARLDAQGPALASARTAMGTPWFFIALESGSLAAVEWFLAQGASPTAPDKGGRLPLETLIQRAALADEFDDHLADLPAMARALVTAGATPTARTLTGDSLADRAATAGLELSSTADKG